MVDKYIEVTHWSQKSIRYIWNNIDNTKTAGYPSKRISLHFPLILRCIGTKEGDPRRRTGVRSLCVLSYFWEIHSCGVCDIEFYYEPPYKKAVQFVYVLATNLKLVQTYIRFDSLIQPPLWHTDFAGNGLYLIDTSLTNIWKSYLFKPHYVNCKTQYNSASQSCTMTSNHLRTF